MPVIFSIILAIGVLLGIIIAKSNGIVTTTDKNDNLSCINEVFSLIENEYVDTINIKDLQITAVTNILETMDPHSEYIKPEILNDVNENLYGSFEGIGVSFRIEKDTITIINTIKGGPSEKVGILAGDRIVYVGDTLVAGVKVTNNDAMRLLKGPKKTKVDVKVKRHGISELLDFTITRDVIPTYSIDVSYMIDDNIGFIKLTKFSSTTYDEFITAIKELKKEGMTKLILDLRGNTGGYLGEAVAIADEILPNNNLIVYTEGENRPRSYVFARHRGMLENDEIAVLIDEGSASASEIVAGALQDNDKGIIVGRRSFGKGLVQEQFDLGDNGALRLTVARYYTPTGRCIQKPFSGNKEEYLLEEYGRYESGEMFSIDSIHFADSLKYVTPGGKIVYGGGGIMPDFFVPVDTTLFTQYHSRLSNKGVLLKVHFQLIDTYREEWMKIYDDYAVFSKKFELDDKMMQQLIEEGEKEGVKYDEVQYRKSEPLIKLQLKALIARDLWDMNEYYHTINVVNESVRKAVELLETDK